MKNKLKRSFKYKVLGIVLTLCLVCAGLASIPNTVNYTTKAEDNYGLASNIQDGTILHCFDWKYNDIKNELPNIAAAGFTSVQTSPAQPGAGSGVWWWLYQPLGFYVATNDLGTKDDLRSLCQEADKYGIKVIVDVVANHLAGDHSNIQNDLKDRQYWHTYGTVSNWADRYQVIQGEIGMPDLNSEHSYVQDRVKNYINELKSLGVDGIRWDAAKHIGLPSEGCNFWPAVTSQGLYHYGEILVGPDDRESGNEGLMKEYTNYMTVTDSSYGKTLRDAFNAGTVPTAFGNWAARGISNNKLIYWSESHDTWSNNKDWGYSNAMSQNVIDRAYAIAASRDDVSALYFSRPSSANKDSILAGQKGSTHFTSKEVAAVNHFHNAMIGQPDYYTTGNNCAVVCRQKGAVIVAGSGCNFNVTVPNGGGTTKPGTYVDEITGEKWTVTSTTISGKIGSTGIAVIYSQDTPIINPNPEKPSEPNPPTSDGTVYYNNTNNWNNVYAYFWSESNAKMTIWPGVQMTNTGDNTYSVGIPSDATQIIFSNGGDLKTDDLTLAGMNKIFENGNWSDYNNVVEPPTEPNPPVETDNNIFYQNTNNWNKVYAYYWSDDNTKMTTWPGIQMSKDGDAFGTKIPADAKYIIFSNGGSLKTDDLTLSGLNKLYNNGSWSTYKDKDEKPTEPDEPVVPTDDNIFFQNTKNWSNVYAYYWSDDNTKMTTWPGVQMSSTENNVYGTKIPADAKYIIFSNGGDSKTEDLTLSGLNKLYNNGTWTNYGTQTDPDEPTTSYIYYKNTNNWNDVYAYYWSDSSTKLSTWPGVKMTSVGNGVYRLEVSADATYIIFNNGNGSQTGDLTINGMNKIYNNGNWSNY